MVSSLAICVVLALCLWQVSAVSAQLSFNSEFPSGTKCEASSYESASECLSKTMLEDKSEISGASTLTTTKPLSQVKSESPSDYTLEPQENSQEDTPNTYHPTAVISKMYIRSDIQFRYARTVVECYAHNPSDEMKEVAFGLDMSNPYFISNFSVRINGEEHVATMHNKNFVAYPWRRKKLPAFRATYDQLSFAVEVSAWLEPSAAVRLSLTYDEMLSRQLGKYEHVIFVRPSRRQTKCITWPLEIIDDFQVDVFINESLPVTNVAALGLKPSATEWFVPSPHAVILQNPDDPSNVQITYKPAPQYQKKNKQDGHSFISQYDVKRGEEGIEMHHRKGHFVHFYAPDHLKMFSRHIVLMLNLRRTENLKQIKDALITIIDDLSDQDYFNIILVTHTKEQHWHPKHEEFEGTSFPRRFQGTAKNRKEAINYVLQMRNSKGDIAFTLDDAISLVSNLHSSNVKPIIIYIENGSLDVVTYNSVKPPTKLPVNPMRVQIHVIIFTPTLQFHYLMESAMENNGQIRIFYEPCENAAFHLENFYHKLAAPLLYEVSFDCTNDSDNATVITPRKFFTSFIRGSELVIAGKIYQDKEKYSTIGCNISAESATGEFKRIVKHSIRQTPEVLDIGKFDQGSTIQRDYGEHNFVERIFAFLTVEKLLAILKKCEKNDPKSYNSPFNLEDIEEDNYEIKERLREMAIKYNFVTKFTSLAFTRQNQEHRLREAMGRADATSGLKILQDREKWLCRIDQDSAAKSLKPSTSKTSCSGFLSMFSRTYLRGLNLTISEDETDLFSKFEAIENVPTSLEVVGDCCWQLFSEKNYTGRDMKFPQGKYQSATNIKLILRNVASVKKLLQCSSPL